MPEVDTGLPYNRQEFVIIDCDVHVQKGDVLAFFNVDVYVGITDFNEPDAQYIQVSGDVTGSVDANVLLGAGTSGFVAYARSN